MICCVPSPIGFSEVFPDALLVSGSVSLLLRVRSFLAKSDPVFSSSSSPDSGGSGVMAGSEESMDKISTCFCTKVGCNVPLEQAFF